MIRKRIGMCSLPKKAFSWKLFHTGGSSKKGPCKNIFMTETKDCKKSQPRIHSRFIHVTENSSIFSNESSNQNYRGFLHLVILLLVVNMVRLVLENYRKYGLLLSIPGRNLNWHSIQVFLLVVIFSLMMMSWAWIIESLFMKNYIKFVFKIINLSLSIGFPTIMVWDHIDHPFLGFVILIVALMSFLKIASFHLVTAEEKQLCTFSHFCYFIAAPTLCFQSKYPQIKRFRKSFFFKRLIESSACFVMVNALIDQYAIPTVKNSLAPILDANIFAIFERILKLSMSSLAIWMLFFYGFFHSYLNLISECLFWADRAFYSDWWNAKTFQDYWRLWNAPVHQYLKRHVYVPLRARGYSSDVAQISCFFLSAIAHEFFVAVPTKIVQGWAFLALILQIPLLFLSRLYIAKYPTSSVGNYFFWICFCILGQPMCILLYYRAWITKRSSSVFFFF